MTCSVLTKKGTLCTRKSIVILENKGFCKQHSKNKYAEMQRADPVWKQQQLEQQKQQLIDQEIMFYKRFGYKKMGILYVGLGNNPISRAKKQQVFLWFLIGKKLQLGKDITTHIAYLLLQILQ